jgi:cobalamin biosynthesis protein CobT
MYSKPLSKMPNDRAERSIRELLKDNTLSRSVRRYLIANKQVGYEYGKKRGKICAKNISRLYSGSPTEQPRIFKERNSSRVHLDTAVMILGDASGSMSGFATGGASKYHLSAACQIALSSVLVPLQIPHAMIQFTTTGDSVMHYNMKSFDESKVNTETLINRYGSSTINMNSNSDGESLLYAASILAQRPESRKLLIVLSDGAPAHMGGDDEYLKDVTKMLEDTKGLELVAIGIRDENVKYFYKQYRVVKDLEQLEPQLLEVLKENLLRR